ncbi:MAG: hypothetical protein RL065_1121, partial [Bacteroidota bacterium]
SWIEHQPSKLGVIGSNPIGITSSISVNLFKSLSNLFEGLFCFNHTSTFLFGLNFNY